MFNEIEYFLQYILKIKIFSFALINVPRLSFAIFTTWSLLHLLIYMQPIHRRLQFAEQLL